MLARRDYSRAELQRRLEGAGYGPDEFEPLLGELQSSGLLSDARMAEARAQSRCKMLGDQRLAHELRQRGVDDSLIESTLAGLPDEYERASAVWRKRFGFRPTDRTGWAQQARFLQSRGFAMGTIRRVLDAPDEEEP